MQRNIILSFEVALRGMDDTKLCNQAGHLFLVLLYNVIRPFEKHLRLLGQGENIKTNIFRVYNNPIHNVSVLLFLFLRGDRRCPFHYFLYFSFCSFQVFLIIYFFY